MIKKMQLEWDVDIKNPKDYLVKEIKDQMSIFPDYRKFKPHRDDAKLDSGEPLTHRIFLESTHKLVNCLSVLSSTVKGMSAAPHVLNGLEFSSMRTRVSKIAEAHPHTFEWIFDEGDGTKSGNGFHSWLKGENGVYG